MLLDTISLIVSIVAICIAVPSMLVARHYYIKTQRIRQSLESRNERPRYG